MQWIDPDPEATPLMLTPLENYIVADDVTPSLPVPLTRRKLASWDPPPLRTLLESVPPPPPIPMRADLDCALSTTAPPPTPAWNTPAFATTSTLVIDWDTSMHVAKPKRGYLGWVAVGAAYALGITTMVMFEQRRVARLATTTVADELDETVDLPLLSKTTPLQEASVITADAVELREPLHIIGYVTDPPGVPLHEPEFAPQQARTAPQPQTEFRAVKTPTGIWPRLRKSNTAPKPDQMEPETEVAQREIDLARLRVVVGAKARQAAGCGDGKRAGSARVTITFAPSGRATNAVVSGGKFNGTRIGSCIASVMRSAQVPPFSGGPATVTKTVKIRR